MVGLKEVLRKGIKTRELPGFETDGKIYSTSGSTVRFCYGIDPIMLMPNVVGGVNIPASYVQIGNQIVINHSFKNSLSEEQRNRFFYADQISSNIFLENHMGYDSTVLSAMLAMKRGFAGSYILDIGTNDGILGTFALRLKAAHVTGIDIKDTHDEVNKTLKINSLNPDDFTFEQKDFADLFDSPPQNIDIYIANVGPEYKNYLKTIRLLKKMPWVKVCIFGGFFDYKYEFTEKCRRLLESYGFKNYQEFYTKVTTPEGEKGRQIAFVMER